MLYTFARFILFLLFKIFFQLKVFGIENFPNKGPIIVTPNHVSYLDPLIVGVGAPRKLIFLARDNLFHFRFFARLLNKLNAFPLKREGGDISAFKLAVGKLLAGQAVLVFPEGTRSNDGKLQDPKLGIGFLEKVTGADVLPCYVKGSVDALPRHSLFPKFKPVSLYFGEPLRFSKEFSGDRKQRYAEIAGRVMMAIAELEKNAR